MFSTVKTLLRRGPVEPQFFKFDDAQLQELANRLGNTYQGAAPFPHIVIDDFLPPRVADHLLAVYPHPGDPVWFDWRTGDTINQPKKLGIRHASRLETADPFIHNVCYAFNAYPFIHFLEQLTGIQNLLPDPRLLGGGLHQILPGGKLKVHADFNYVEGYGLYRKINAILYLNKNWQELYGGHLELWTSDMSACQTRVAPIFNRCVVFNTAGRAFHGHPDPLACPDNMTRKSMAFYFYSKLPDAGEEGPHGVLWQERPGEGQTK